MPYPPKRPPFWQTQSQWAQATLASLSLEQKIAQLLHVATWSNKGPTHETDILALIEQYGIGGLCFFQGTAMEQAAQTIRYQQASQVPLMISIDGEWGLAMRLSDTLAYPYQAALGSVGSLDLLYEMGADMARQCKAIGVHVNFAPVVDINTEPNNPVIGFRSFGADPTRVAECGLAYARGMEDAGVMAVLKHFPGHGDTAVDSHLDLPVLGHDRARLDAVELAPFRRLIKAGIGGVMTGHLRVPALDDRPHIGATLSRAMSHDLLQRELGFKGLVFTDALDMKGVSKYFTAAEINRMAFEAGNDVMLFCVDVPGSIAAIKQMIEQGQIPEAELDRRCLKSLLAKAWVAADQIPAPPLPTDLVNPARQQLIHRLFTAAIQWQGTDTPPQLGPADIWLHLRPGPLPPAADLAHHQLSGGQHQPGASLFEALAAAGQPCYSLHSESSVEAQQSVWDALASSPGNLWLSIGGLGLKAGNQFGITPSFVALMARALAAGPTAVVWQANPYAQHHVPAIHVPLLMAYQEHGLATEAIMAACRA